MMQPRYPEYTDPSDPQNWPIAMVFLEAFQRELGQKALLLQFLRSDAGAQYAAQVAPGVSREYERQTQGEQAEVGLFAAIGMGVAAAIRFAATSQRSSP